VSVSDESVGLLSCHSSFLFSDGNATDAAVSYLLNFVSLSAIVLLCFGPLSVQFCHPNGMLLVPGFSSLWLFINFEFYP
jgi:hypothetical protein